MSSFLAHAAVGVSIGVGRRKSVSLIASLVVLSWAPDIDYAFRMLGYEPTVRWTHSFVFVLLVWIAANALARATIRNERISAIAPLFLAALLSHLLMDFLVGLKSYGDPLFWPLSDKTYSSPVGLLPAAGKLDPRNYYLWRNLLIEAGMIGPLLFLYLQQGRAKLAAIIAAIVIMAPFLFWSAGLSR